MNSTIFDDGTWNKTFLLFDQFINHNTVYIDIGAWIGPIVLYASRLAKKYMLLSLFNHLMCYMLILH
jgi:hypothetical protein